jgi:hypothetical protein
VDQIYLAQDRVQWRARLNTVMNLVPYYYSMALQPISGLGLLLGSVILYTIGRTPWTSDQPVARPLLTQDNTNTE